MIVDIFFNMAQNLETIDENQITIQEIFNRLIKIRSDLTINHINSKKYMK